MTVGDLIKKLQEYPPDLRVVTPGFDESDFDEVVVRAKTIFLKLDVHPNDLSFGGRRRPRTSCSACDGQISIPTPGRRDYS